MASATGRIISFAWTTPALLAGRKSVTRREWVPKWARSFRAGEVCQAYDRSPRLHGIHIANIKLRSAPYLQSVAIAPDSDYEAEGLAYLEEIGALVGSGPDGSLPSQFWNDWRAGGEELFVVRFELLELTPAGITALAKQLAELDGTPPPAGPQLGLTLPPTTGELHAEREALHG